MEFFTIEFLEYFFTTGNFSQCAEQVKENNYYPYQSEQVELLENYEEETQTKLKISDVLDFAELLKEARK
ncbi:hypothetical protein [Tenacibaculum finnmarkense]|uniref:hypothetical protein n=1 Tax=Tenacibaculum finnmarkense TaxID=2781243 RepID=UPI001EFA3675|nr:hypothetical protein [Tenacibaculum finnmarkense]MCG8226396.1 hypothetical protein [Tenacibaculum finnmarkense genomovar finnmarkense]